MEASQAGLAGGDAAQQGDAQQGAEAPAWATDFVAQLDGQAQGQEAVRQEMLQMRQFLESQPWQGQEQQQADEQSALDLGFLDVDPAGADDPREMQQQVRQQFESALKQAVSAEAQAQVAPIAEQWQEFRRAQEYTSIAHEFPELQQTETANQVMDLTRQLVEANDHPELAQEPWLVRLVYMAGRGYAEHEQEQQEGPRGPMAATLEGGGGARPTSGQQGDAAEEYRQALKGAARGGRSALPF